LGVAEEDEGGTIVEGLGVTGNLPSVLQHGADRRRVFGRGRGVNRNVNRSPARRRRHARYVRLSLFMAAIMLRKLALRLRLWGISAFGIGRSDRTSRKTGEQFRQDSRSCKSRSFLVLRMGAAIHLLF